MHENRRVWFKFVKKLSEFLVGSSVMVKAMGGGFIVSEFELQSLYYVHFRTNIHGKGMNPLILPAISWILPLLFFSKDGFGIK